LTSVGALYVWGSNESGELGVGDFSERVAPFPLLSLKDRKVLQISTGGAFTIAVGEKNEERNSSPVPIMSQRVHSKKLNDFEARIVNKHSHAQTPTAALY
jgi:hypothetical protein